MDRGAGTGVIGTARRWLATPGVIAFVASPRVRSRPHAAYRIMRRLDPLHESPVGVIWVLSRHADVNAALRHPGLGSDEDKADFDSLRFLSVIRVLFRRQGGEVLGIGGPFETVFSNAMLFKDPPDHTRLRDLVNKAFTPRAVESLEGRITEIVDELLERALPKGRMELLSELAYPLPARVICELLGVLGDEGADLIARHAPALATRLDPSPMRTPEVVAAGDRAVVELSAYLNDLIGARRAAPQGDLLSALLAAEDEGDRLSHDELVATLLLLLIAGHETTANLIGNGLLALLRHPEQLARLRDDPTLDRTAVEELLRYDGPIHMAERIALDDVELGGRTIPKGRVVILGLAAANRDPDVFTDPNRLDVARVPNPHVGFGGGAHFCLGAPLARLEARLALRRLLNRLPGVRLEGPPPRWRSSFTIRGVTALQLSW